MSATPTLSAPASGVPTTAERLFQPVRVGRYELPHRIVMAPLTRSRARQPGNVPPALSACYYAQRSRTPGTQQRLRDAVAEAAMGRFVRYEVDIRGAGDTVATIDFSLKPIPDESGRIVLLIPEGRDITGRKRAEQPSDPYVRHQHPNTSDLTPVR